MPREVGAEEGTEGMDGRRDENERPRGRTNDEQRCRRQTQQPQKDMQEER